MINNLNYMLYNLQQNIINKINIKPLNCYCISLDSVTNNNRLNNLNVKKKIIHTRGGHYSTQVKLFRDYIVFITLNSRFNLNTTNSATVIALLFNITKYIT